MPYVKITGYVEVPDQDYIGGHDVLTSDGHEEIRAVSVDDLEDLRIQPDDRQARR